VVWFEAIGLLQCRDGVVRLTGFQKRLAQRGFTEAEIAKVRCPIGVSKHSKEPSAIAISVAAELLDVLQAESKSD